MDTLQLLYLTCAFTPVVFMGALALVARQSSISIPRLWRFFLWVSLTAMVATGASFPVVLSSNGAQYPGLVTATSLSLILALLVQLLGAVIGAFSARYLVGESGQPRYIAALATVLASVHLLLIADHWLLFITAWASVGIALQQLLCFYSDRPFALLAAHKKRIADRLADLMLIAAAALAWNEAGSGSLSDLWRHIAQHGMSLSLQSSAILLVLAVILRTALLPVHGWLIQVMEAPTPVSALLHAGVVNLGGFVIIRFAPLLDQATSARMLLLVFGLATAVLAGMVMLTRVSIKVRLAWSTVAQMGFMLLECALGLYTLAALHLIGHSLYKAHAFLSASTAVRQTRSQILRGISSPSIGSLVMAPILAVSMVLLVQILLQMLAGQASWPWWWSVILGLAWAPMLWLPESQTNGATLKAQSFFGLVLVIGLTLSAAVAHLLPFQLIDAPHTELGLVALMGMALLYLFQAILQARPQLLSHWRRRSYAGFYLDEAYTRLALTIWPTRWTPKSATLPLTNVAQ